MKSRLSSILIGIAFISSILAVSLFAPTHGWANDIAPLYLSIEDPLQKAFFQTQARPDGEEMVYHIKGYAYAYLRGDSGTSGPPSFTPKHGRKVFGIEGYNIRRAIRIPGTNDFVVATREIVFYTDSVTGQVLQTWNNPYTSKVNTVVPIANDHVNFKYRVENGVLKSVVELASCTPPGPPVLVPAPFPPTAIGPPSIIGDSYLWSSDIFPRYSLNSRYCITDGIGLKNNYYTSSEIFDFYVSEKEVVKRTRWPYSTLKPPKGVPAVKNSWVRNAPWVPWMCMKEVDYDGVLEYHASSELLESWEDLPSWMKNLVETQYPLYMHAPDEIVPTPNATSWTSFYYDILQPTGQTWGQWCGFPQ